MSLVRCPGAERIRMSFPEEVGCACGVKLEMWPDDFKLCCPGCGRTVERAVPPACIEWCAAARDCVGAELYEKYMLAREKRETVGLRDRLLEAMKAHFGDDERRVRHAEKVTAFAEEILEKENAHHGVVTAASVLHDIGIPEAERKYGSAAARFQEKEGPPIARGIMEKIGIDGKVIDEVCDIIGHHHSPRDKETTNFGVVYDADIIVNILEERERSDKHAAGDEARAVFLTSGGKKTAEGILGKSLDEKNAR